MSLRCPCGRLSAAMKKGGKAEACVEAFCFVHLALCVFLGVCCLCYLAGISSRVFASSSQNGAIVGM